MRKSFVDNKLSIHFGEDITKCIFFSLDKSLYDSNKIKQFHMVEYLGCCLDANFSGESMAMEYLKYQWKVSSYIDKMSVYIQNHLS